MDETNQNEGSESESERRRRGREERRKQYREDDKEELAEEWTKLKKVVYEGRGTLAFLGGLLVGVAGAYAGVKYFGEDAKSETAGIDHTIVMDAIL